ncbi:MAG: DUF5678 domain-containing protein [Candidatus Curtissbacteria bacterium]|nr:DUF5678 domain-containing protein [Candidatus Curtissbacteria bacterium]
MAIDWSTIFKKYRGKWIALKDDEKTVIAAGETAVKALESAKKKGHQNPILVEMPKHLVPLTLQT